MTDEFSGVTGAVAEKEKNRTPKLLLQCLLAGLYIFIVLAVSNWFDYFHLCACLGASAMLVFLTPGAEAARVRHVIGGYAVSSVCGLLASQGALLAGLYAGWRSSLSPQTFFCALAVFAAVLSMKLTNLRHPPATALAVILTLSEAPLPPFAQSMAAVLLLCAMKTAFRRLITDF